MMKELALTTCLVLAGCDETPWESKPGDTVCDRLSVRAHNALCCGRSSANDEDWGRYRAIKNEMTRIGCNYDWPDHQIHLDNSYRYGPEN